MTDYPEWKTTERWKPRNGSGKAVERDGALGYAKSNKLTREKIASCLAQEIGLPVPKIEFGMVHGNLCTISLVRDDRVYEAGEPGIVRTFKENEKLAISRSVGLLPYLAWIGATDHYSAANYAFETENDGSLRFITFDFDDAFQFNTCDEEISLICLPEMRSRPDRTQIISTLEIIENLSVEAIEQCCEDEPRLAELLNCRRRSKLHDYFLSQQLI